MRWIGRDALDVAYRVDRATRSRLLMRSEEPLLSATAPANRVSLDGDGALFRLAAEASLTCSIPISPAAECELAEVCEMPMSIDDAIPSWSSACA